MANLSDAIVVKILNILGYLLLLSGNAWSIADPTKSYANGKDTFISPADWAYWVWGLIYILLLGTIIYQFTDKGTETVAKGINWRFPLYAVLQYAWIVAWIHQRYIIAFILALCVSSTSTHIYYRMKKYHSTGYHGDELFVHLPFSLLQGWTTCLVVLSAFAAFGKSTDQHPGIFTKVFVFLGFVFLEFTAAAYAWYSSEGDLPAAAVISYYLWSVFVHQTKSRFIRYSALAFAILSLFNVAKSAYGLLRKRRGAGVILDEERQPILGGGS